MSEYLVIKKTAISKAKIKTATGNIPLEQIDAPFTISADESGKLIGIFSLLYKANKIDFTNYKQSTVKRRIIRRMELKRIGLLSDYIAYLKKNPTELTALSERYLDSCNQFLSGTGHF